MDLTFDIRNEYGDHVMVALTSYDRQNLETLTEDRRVLSLEFYDVSLFRMSGEGYVGPKILFKIINILAKFLSDNPAAVFTFYCDPKLDIARKHVNLLPQEYRSRLFTRMFELYTRVNNACEYVNKVVRIEDGVNVQFVHFICRRELEDRVNVVKRAIGGDK